MHEAYIFAFFCKMCDFLNSIESEGYVHECSVLLVGLEL